MLASRRCEVTRFLAPISAFAWLLLASAQAVEKQASNNLPISVDIAASIDRSLSHIATTLDRASRVGNPKAQEDREERNIIAQETVATWAPRMFFVGLAEILITSLGVFLVYRTLVHTKEAAVAARTQANVAVAAFEKIERPHMYVQAPQRIYREYGQQQPWIDYKVGNLGKVAAIIDEVLVTFSDSTTGLPEEPLLESLNHPLLSQRVREPGDWIELRIKLPDHLKVAGGGAGNVKPEIPENADLFFRLLVRYHGPFTERHETSGCWRYDSPTMSFVQAIDDLNYVR